jgi:thiamine biosynthesis protein ThiI
MFNYIVVHYHEIGLKGKNRIYFERKLVNNIQHHLKETVSRIHGRILIKLEKFSEEEYLKTILKKIPGINVFAFAYIVESDIEKIKNKAVEIAKNEEFESFAVATKRANKQFPLDSVEINKQVGGAILKATNKKVDLKNPEMKFYIELTKDSTFLYTKKYKGFGGLPVGITGTVVSLLSGGLDSPVASIEIMKRGCKAILLHFYNTTINSEKARKKVIDLAKIISKYQIKTKLYLIKFDEIQKEIIKNINSKYRMIIYRRMMLRLATEIAEKEKAKAIVTGESLAQVASQTLENMDVITKAIDMLVLRPLVSLDKQEIMEKAKKYETYETSIQPYGDCCSFFIAKHPETKARLKDIEEMEKNIDIGKISKQALENIEVFEIMSI